MLRIMLYVRFSKLFLMLLVTNLGFVCAEEQHPELAIYTVLARECPSCERIYNLRNQMNYLNKTRLDALNAIEKWLEQQAVTLEKRIVRDSLIDLKKASDSLVNNLAHDAKVDTKLQLIKQLINNIDPNVPTNLKLEHKNFYEVMEQIWNINKDLETQAVPDAYNKWLTKRLALRI